ncbi:ATP-dependent DNA ligase [Pseudonocardia sp.]|uniref:ATP-dependent DNA ligase n=1 Tax=Pseudonocardia sp. TaxID=60912 RepID=UPI0031FE390B
MSDASVAAGGADGGTAVLADVAAASAAVAGTSARLGKVTLLAELLSRTDPAEVAAAVAWLSGELRQRQIGVGWASLREVPPPAAEPSLRIGDVDAAFAAIGRTAGAGSQAGRRRLLTELFARATAQEQLFVRRLLVGELRQGALEGVMADALAKASGLPARDVRRAVMLRGDLGAVAAAALSGGAPALAEFRLQVGRPVLPMLAQTADGVGAALERVRPAAVEWKLDGARVQVHRSGTEVGVFTRSLDDITARVPEVVEAALALPVDSAVLDGEVIALRPDGRPQPFQVTASRVGSRGDPIALRTAVPLWVFLFDVLHLDGEDLLDSPGSERADALAGVVPEALRVPRVVVSDEPAAAAMMADALAHGHEGVLVKSLTGPYEAGRRGAGWIKVKPRHTLDLVVLAVERGHGRRSGWLSNLHLGARDPRTGGFVMLGKTFKGLTDELLRWQTERLGALAVADDGWVVRVRPELVVEIAFDGVQTSPRYPGGMALRFARVLRYREDKSPADADTIDTVRAIHTAQPP